MEKADGGNIENPHAFFRAWGPFEDWIDKTITTNPDVYIRAPGLILIIPVAIVYFVLLLPYAFF